MLRFLEHKIKTKAKKMDFVPGIYYITIITPTQHATIYSYKMKYLLSLY